MLILDSATTDAIDQYNMVTYLHCSVCADDDDLQAGQIRRSQRLHGKERCSAEDLTASALNALRLSKRQVPAKVYDPSNAEHRWVFVGIACAKGTVLYWRFIRYICVCTGA